VAEHKDCAEEGPSHRPERAALPEQPGPHFRLLRFFTLACLVIVPVVFVLATMTATSLVYDALLEQEQDEADSLGEDILQRLAAGGYGYEKWGEPVPDRLWQTLKPEFENFDIRTFVILSQDGKTLAALGDLETEERQLWREGFEAARSGQVTLRWETRSSLPLYLLRSGRHGLVETYAPAKVQGRPVAGVVGIRRDLSMVVAAAHRMVPPILAIFGTGTLVVFGGLWLLVRAADLRLQRKRQAIEDANVRLAEQNARLQEYSRRKDQFVATCSHDLRSPLISIQAGCTVLLSKKQGPLNTTQEEILVESLSRSRNVIHLINDLLDLARIEAGCERLVVEQLDAVEIVREALRLHEEMAHPRKIALRVEGPGGGAPIQADRLKLLRICNNLISNAIKHSPPGEVLARVSRAAESVRIQIEDHGPGMTADEQTKIFERFSSGKRTRDEGTGLGLTITRELVALHHGRIEVLTAVNKGTTFVVSLPAQQPHAPPGTPGS
jgi:signal transduction histidine kinase